MSETEECDSEYPEPPIKTYFFDNEYQDNILYICIMPGRDLKPGIYRVIDYEPLDKDFGGQSVTYDEGNEFKKLGFNTPMTDFDIRDRMVPWVEAVKKWPEYLV